MQHTILAVDDNVDNLWLMEALLISFGYKVVTASSYRTALETFHRMGETVDALVTDYNLGDGTGADLVSAMGEQVPRVRILVTGNIDVIFRMSFDAILEKPIDTKKLRSVLQSLLSLPIAI